jgi:hypothetical protein
MASTNGVTFPKSMANILANPVDIRFSSMLAKSTAPAACLVIDQPTPSDLIAGIHRVEGTLSDTIKVCECVKHPRRTSSSSSMPLNLRNTHVASRYMKRKIQRKFGPKIQDLGSRRSHLDKPCPIHENPKHTAR